MDNSELIRSYDFTGKTVVVTGGSGVLGGGIAGALAACGANVAILARNLEPAQQLLETMGTHAQHATAVSADVTSPDSVSHAAEIVRQRFGSVDALVNAAGGNRPQATTGGELRFFDLPADALRGVIDLNLMGTILPCQVFGKMMAEKGQGVILNVSSMAAVRPLTRVIGYSAAKAGVNSFTTWLAVHMAEEYSPNIRVNAIAPGFFLGIQNRRMLVDGDTGKLTPRGQSIINHTPMRRFGQPEDLFGAALWLLSPASAFVTGIVVPVDGGFSACAGV